MQENEGFLRFKIEDNFTRYFDISKPGQYSMTINDDSVKETKFYDEFIDSALRIRRKFIIWLKFVRLWFD